MDCPAVREHLTDFVLGTLEPDRRRFVERHLEWCAGCRKEQAELAEGATVAASSLTPAEPPPGLEDLVVASIVEAAGRRERRRPKVAIAAAGLAAVIAIGAFGWALAMTGRLSEFRKAADQAQDRAAEFESVLREILIEADDGRILSADLVGVGGAAGGGRGILFDSPGGTDWALVITGGLPPANGPYHAYLTTGGTRQRVGRLSPSAMGEMAAYRIFSRDVSGAHWVSVRDSSGNTVLRGSVTTEPR